MFRRKLKNFSKIKIDKNSNFLYNCTFSNNSGGRLFAVTASAKTFKTEILVDDEKEFRLFLKERGFGNIEVFSSEKDEYLYLYFDNAAQYMKYKLRGIEQSFMATRSHTYYYDLDQPFDELDDIFGEDE